MSDCKDIVQLLKRGCVCSSEFGKCIRCEAAEHIEHLKAEVERLQTAGVHTCHDQCQRYACVQFRRAEAAEAEVAAMKKERAELTNRYNDAVDGLKAAEAEVERLKLDYGLLADTLRDDRRAAEAQASRMRDALEKISDRTRDGQHCALIASEALEDSSTGNS